MIGDVCGTTDIEVLKRVNGGSGKTRSGDRARGFGGNDIVVLRVNRRLFKAFGSVRYERHGKGVRAHSRYEGYITLGVERSKVV